MNFYDRAKHYPPCLVRLLARKRYGLPMSAGEIANRSYDFGGIRLSTFEVEAISQQTDWKGVDLQTMEAFLKACNFDFCDPASLHRVEEYLRSKPNFRYLRADKANWKTYWLPLLIKWVKSCDGKNIKHTPVRGLLVRLKPIANQA